MISIATLGPKNTFSEIVAKAFASKLSSKKSIKLFPTIKKIFHAVNGDCKYGILPIENMVDGYVQPVLDMLLVNELKIIDEMLLPIQFSFVANCDHKKDVKRIFAQFVTQGQCSEFLDTVSDVDIITTHSNGTSIENILSGKQFDGAIIPTHTLNNKAFFFPLIVKNVNDYTHNQTRFIVVSKDAASYHASVKYKTSIIIIEGTDRPGMLSDILRAFSKRSINLLSIMSRPTKESFGQYHFFVDFEGHIRTKKVKEALSEIEKCGDIKVLGSYPKAGKPLINFDKPVIDLEYNPFNTHIDKPKVFITKGTDPYKNTVKALSHFDLSHLKGKKVLLKPNVGRAAKNGTGVVTNPNVVAAVIDCFKKAGAKVSIGESPIVGVNVMQAFDVCGLSEMAKERKCSLIDMDKRKPLIVSIPEGQAIETLKVCADVFDFDLVVSIPVMKMHMHTGVSLGIKNMKGCLYGRSKVDLHMLPPLEGSKEKSLNIAIVDMSSVLRPHLTIIDGSVGQEGLGPSAGDPKKVGIIIIGADPFATDAIACQIMGIAAQDIPHLRMAAERGYGIIDTKKIKVVPGNWLELVNPFAPVPENISIEYPGVHVLDENSCSACQSTVLLFLKRYGHELGDYFPDSDKINIAIGKGLKKIPKGSVCVGNCTRMHKEQGTFVPGCPPVASSILKLIKEK